MFLSDYDLVSCIRSSSDKLYDLLITFGSYLDDMGNSIYADDVVHCASKFHFIIENLLYCSDFLQSHTDKLHEIF